MPSSYMNKEYRQIRREMIFEREKAFMISTQRAIEMKELKKQIRQMLRERKESTDRKERRDLTMRIWDSEEKLNDLKDDIIRYDMNCVNSECSGKVSSSEDTAICGLCNTEQCTKCKTEIEGSNEHSCDPNILATLKMISATSKQCPGCDALITKIEGCSQMFCTQCYTLFNFNTLRVEHGFRHNPHYLDWIAANPDKGELVNQAGPDVPFAELYDVNKWHIMRNIKTFEDDMKRAIVSETANETITADVKKQISSQIGYVAEWVSMRFDSITNVPGYVCHDEMTNLPLRIRFLKNEIDEDKFKQYSERRVFKSELNNRLLTYAKAVQDMTPADLSQFVTVHVFASLDPATNTPVPYFHSIDWVIKMVELYNELCEDAASYGKCYHSDNMEELFQTLDNIKRLSDN